VFFKVKHYSAPSTPAESRPSTNGGNMSGAAGAAVIDRSRTIGGTARVTDLIATARRRGGLAAELAAELADAQRQLEDALGRSGPEYLADHDVELAGWLALAARRHPLLEEPMTLLYIDAAARAQLAELISRYHCCDVPSGERPRAELLRIAAEIHELCAAHGYGPGYADALVLDEDDHAWRRRYVREAR
jgi:hypothetical protein